MRFVVYGNVSGFQVFLNRDIPYHLLKVEIEPVLTVGSILIPFTQSFCENRDLCGFYFIVRLIQMVNCGGVKTRVINFFFAKAKLIFSIWEVIMEVGQFQRIFLSICFICQDVANFVFALLAVTRR